MCCYAFVLESRRNFSAKNTTFFMDISSDQLNIFQMYVAYGGPGFWLRRTTWGSTCARVVGMGDPSGPAPYFGNPPVLADIYTLDGRLKEELARLPAAGTYKTWRQIDPPTWASHVLLRSSNDTAVTANLARHDRRKKTSNADQTTRVELSVPYARKDEAKAIGARWDAAKKVWWIAADNKAALTKAIEGGLLNH